MKIHIDIDCFFVSAHRINNPQYCSIPLAVGGRSNLSIFDTKKQINHLSSIDGAFSSSILNNKSDQTFEEYFLDSDKKVRGIITTSSYEARKYGIKTAIPVAEAIRYCPHLIVLPPNYPLYHKLSLQLKKLLEKELPHIEQFSIDEFFGDITGWIDDNEAEKFCIDLKKKIFNEIGIPVSIGIAKSKWIAKLATNAAKPDGVKYILDKNIYYFTKHIPIKDFPGIGKAYQDKLSKYNIKTLGDIKERKDLFYTWGKAGVQIYNRVCGIDNEEILITQKKKSIGLGRSFDPLFNRKEIKRRITILSRHLTFLSIKDNHNPMTFSIKIKYQYGQSCKDFINSNRLFSELYVKEEMIKLFNKIDIHPSHAIIQLNLTLSNFKENKQITMDLLNYEKDIKKSNLTTSMQKLRDKYGIDIIKSAGEL